MSDAANRTYRYAGSLQSTDSESFITLPFDVHSGCSAIRMLFRVDPLRVGQVRNIINVGLYDPHGWRGQSHRHPPDEEIIVSGTQATRGFMAGPLPTGRWQAQIAAFVVMPSSPACSYALDIEVSYQPVSGVDASYTATPAPAASAPSASSGPRWYRGEMHTHTRHSDGHCTLREVAAYARERRLDFLCLTDHNTISGWQDIAAVQESGLQVIPGLELTTFHGHAVALGIDRWVDWRVGYNGWTMNDAARAVHDAGGLFIIAHPWSIGSPDCSGCRWQYEDMDLLLADGIEAWSSAWARPDSHNPCNLRFWYERLAEGHALTAVAAADFHSPQQWSDLVPVTYVYADDLSIAGILDGLRRRRVMISSGPWLELQQTATRWVLLENVLAGGPTRTNVVAAWRDAPAGARLRLHHGAAVLDEALISDQGRLAFAVPAGQVHAELWSTDDHLLAMTNPLAVSSSTT